MARMSVATLALLAVLVLAAPATEARRLLGASKTGTPSDEVELASDLSAVSLVSDLSASSLAASTDASVPGPPLSPTARAAASPTATGGSCEVQVSGEDVAVATLKAALSSYVVTASSLTTRDELIVSLGTSLDKAQFVKTHVMKSLPVFIGSLTRDAVSYLCTSAIQAGFAVTVEPLADVSLGKDANLNTVGSATQG